MSADKSADKSAEKPDIEKSDIPAVPPRAPQSPDTPKGTASPKHPPDDALPPYQPGAVPEPSADAVREHGKKRPPSYYPPKRAP